MEPITDCSLTKELGGCCCSCRWQITLKAHPGNTGFGKGPITQTIGYVCTMPELSELQGVFFEGVHGFCEMYTQREVS